MKPSQCINGRLAIKLVFVFAVFGAIVFDWKFFFEATRVKKVSDLEKLEVKVNYVPLVKSREQVQSEIKEKLNVRLSKDTDVTTVIVIVDDSSTKGLRNGILDLVTGRVPTKFADKLKF